MKSRAFLAGPRPRHLGRRGLFLAFLAILDAAYGYSLLQPPAPIRPTAYQAYPILPQHVWAVIWLAACAVCASGILARRDRWQFAAAATLKVAWAARSAYLWWLGVPQAWIAVAVWLAFAFTVVVISGWPEPPPPPATPPPPHPDLPPRRRQGAP